MRRWWYIAGSVLLILAALAAIFLIPRRESAPAVTCGPYELTNTELGYYYWSEYFYFDEAYGDYLAGTVDFSRPLAEQTYDDARTWEDYLLEQTLLTVRENLAMAAAAEAEGFALPKAEEEACRRMLEDLTAAARSGGYADLDAYLQASYGPHADTGSLSRYLRHIHLAAAYADRLLERCLPSDAECRAWFAENRAFYEADDAVDADNEATWLEPVRVELQHLQYEAAIDAICADAAFTAHPEAIVLTPPENLYP